MKTPLLLITAISAALVPARSAHCAQSSVPVLREYATDRRIYFAREADNGVVYSPSTRGSNVFVYATLSVIGDKVRAAVDYWIDDTGRPHALSVLKLQIEFNRELERIQYPYGYSYGRTPYPLLRGVSSVTVTGILDLQTLRIPAARLTMRLDAMRTRSWREFNSANLLEGKDPGAATLKRKYASYWQEKIAAAQVQLNVLNSAMDATPMISAPGWIHVQPSDSFDTDGLSDIEIDYSEMNEVEHDGRTSRFQSRDYASQRPEIFVQSYADPAAMTSDIYTDLRAKQDAASAAIEAAGKLCKDLFAPPCP